MVNKNTKYKTLSSTLLSLLCSGSAPGVNEICPELLKALEVVGLSGARDGSETLRGYWGPCLWSGGPPFQEGGPQVEPLWEGLL